MAGVNDKMIRRKRIELNLTQEELAEKAKVSRSQIQRIESRNVNCGIDTLMKIANALNCECSELVDNDNEE